MSSLATVSLLLTGTGRAFATVITAPVKVVHEGVDWATWLIAVGTLLLAGAAWCALLSLRDAKRNRHATLITDLTRRWDETVVAASSP